jgi:hypothetical protein
VDERDAAERPLVIDGSAPPIAHSYIHAFAEVVRLHDLVLDKEELPLLLLHFHPALHGSYGEGQITARASESVFSLCALSWRLGQVVFRQRLFEGMEFCRDVGTAACERETMQIARSFFPDRLVNKPVQLVSVDRLKGTLLIAGDVDLSHALFPYVSSVAARMIVTTSTARRLTVHPSRSAVAS